ncbi:flagellar hook-length control protein FliK [Halioxenophilus aromaticivorans]
MTSGIPLLNLSSTTTLRGMTGQQGTVNLSPATKVTSPQTSNSVTQQDFAKLMSGQQQTHSSSSNLDSGKESLIGLSARQEIFGANVHASSFRAEPTLHELMSAQGTAIANDGAQRGWAVPIPQDPLSQGLAQLSEELSLAQTANQQVTNQQIANQQVVGEQEDIAPRMLPSDSQQLPAEPKIIDKFPYQLITGQPLTVTEPAPSGVDEVSNIDGPVLSESDWVSEASEDGGELAALDTEVVRLMTAAESIEVDTLDTSSQPLMTETPVLAEQQPPMAEPVDIAPRALADEIAEAYRPLDDSSQTYSWGMDTLNARIESTSTPNTVSTEPLMADDIDLEDLAQLRSDSLKQPVANVSSDTSSPVDIEAILASESAADLQLQKARGTQSAADQQNLSVTALSQALEPSPEQSAAQSTQQPVTNVMPAARNLRAGEPEKITSANLNSTWQVTTSADEITEPALDDAGLGRESTVSKADSNNAAKGLAELTAALGDHTASQEEAEMLDDGMASFEDALEGILSKNALKLLQSGSSVTSMANALANLESKLPTNPLAQLAIPQSVSSASWGSEVTDKVMWMASQGVTEAEIQLDPPELGPLQARVVVQQDQAQVVFTSHSAQVREALDQQATRLREMFANEGLELTDVGVSDQQAQDSKDSQHGGERGSAAQPALAGNTEPGAVAEAQNSTPVVMSQYLVDQYV